MSIPSVSDETMRKIRRTAAVADLGRTDRLPPHSLEAEQGVLGCVLLSPNECLSQVRIKITDSDAFYDLRNKTVFEALTKMQDAAEQIDIITLQQHLKDDGLLDQIGGIAYLNAMQDGVPSAANLTYYLDIVEEKYTLRKLIQTCTDVVGKVYDFDGKVEELLDQAERDILTIRPTRHSSTGIKALVQQAIDKIEYRCYHPDEITGHTTGLIDLDQMSDGIHGGEMIVVAGYTSTGKTALSVNIAIHNALKGIPVAIFSAEMLPVQIAIRSICANARANFKKLTEANVPGMVTSAGQIAKAPIYIEAANGMTVGQMQATARRLKQKHGIKIIVVDYIQLLTGTGDNREQQISNISKGCKAMALENDCAVLALSQLTDDGKLRESRAIGHDADSVWKLENDGDWQPIVQPIKLNIDKCRDGETGGIRLTFMKQWTLFTSASKVSDEDVP